MPDLARRHFNYALLASATTLAAAPLRAISAPVRPDENSALIVVDVQNCFVTGGTLPVNNGEQVVPVINKLAKAFANVVITQDWHTSGHVSFASSHKGKRPFDTAKLAYGNQVLWPDHCVQGRPGAALAPGLKTTGIAHVFPKGESPSVDSYSGFFDNGRRRATGLAAWLRSRGVTEVDVVGLATDYCVKATAMDAVGEGFATRVLLEGCRGVELAPGDTARAVAAMREGGVTVVGA